MSTAVASIAENTGGGLYAYRCSKAGLNMSMKVSDKSKYIIDHWSPFGIILTLILDPEPVCGPGWHGCACHGHAPGMGSHWDGRAQCTGVKKNKSINSFQINRFSFSSDHNWNLLLNYDPDIGWTHWKGNFANRENLCLLAYMYHIIPSAAISFEMTPS